MTFSSARRRAAAWFNNTGKSLRIDNGGTHSFYDNARGGIREFGGLSQRQAGCNAHRYDRSDRVARTGYIENLLLPQSCNVRAVDLFVVGFKKIHTAGTASH